jgi:stearoyl-CoA desaturase (delta-9 desaturase)
VFITTYKHQKTETWFKNIYSKFPYAGVTLLLLIDLLFFSWWGIWVWSVQMIWIPFWAAGVINGIGHYYGYRNYDTKDKSTNIIPWGILIGGEELHNNHHGDPANPKLSRKWLEFDIGWMWFNIFKFLKLVK